MGVVPMEVFAQLSTTELVVMLDGVSAVGGPGATPCAGVVT
jgi:hypothetical protein